MNLVLYDAERNELHPALMAGEHRSGITLRFADAKGRVTPYPHDVEEDALEPLIQWLGSQLQGDIGPGSAKSWAQQTVSAWRSTHSKEVQESRSANDQIYLEMFNSIDADDSGYVTLGELVDAIRKAKMAPPGEEATIAQEHMGRIDNDLDGKISPNEWLAFFREMEDENGAPTPSSQTLTPTVGPHSGPHGRFAGPPDAL